MQSERLYLEPLSLGDAPFILSLLNDPQFLAFIGDRQVRNLDDARTWIKSGPLVMYDQHGFGLFRVILRTNGQPIGLCGLLRREGLADVDIGFAFLPEYRNRGYALEAARATLAYGFQVLKLKRIVAIVSPQNRRSYHLLERLGMQPQGTVRMPADGPDKLLYALDAPHDPTAWNGGGDRPG